MLLEDFEFVHIQEKRGAPYAVAIPNGKTASHCKEAEAARPGAVSEPPYSPLSAAPEPTAPSKQVQPTLPPPSASVNEVREYIKITLIVKYNTSQEYADEIAMKWTLGRGWTLREYSESDFRRCFGPEIGLSLHRAVKEARKVDTRPTETQELEKWTKRGGPQEYRNVTGISLIFAAIMLIVRERLNYALIMLAIPQLFMATVLPTRSMREGAVLRAMPLLAWAFFVTDMGK